MAECCINSKGIVGIHLGAIPVFSKRLQTPSQISRLLLINATKELHEKIGELLKKIDVPAESRLQEKVYPAGRLEVSGLAGTLRSLYGTDGKTTTTYLISAVLESAGRVTGLMGTVEHKVGPVWRENRSRQTTAEAPEVQELLAEMRDRGVTHAIVESSSHGLELR